MQSATRRLLSTPRTHAIHAGFWRLGPLLFACFVGLSTTVVHAFPAQTQQIGLSAGWNLISIQVGPGVWSIPQIQSGLDKSNVLVAIWGYDTDPSPPVWRSWQASPSDYPNDLRQLQLGRGYWVNVSQSCTLTLAGSPWAGPLTLTRGWNLVGFPGLAQREMGLADFNSVFRTNLARIPQIWTWDAGTAQRFTGYDVQTLPPITNLTGVAAGRGYWVRSLDVLDLVAEPQILLPPDIDSAPLATNSITITNALGIFTGPEAGVGDPDLNGNGILDGASTQTAIEFAAGINQQLITIANQGLGAIDWGVAESIPWLSVNGTNFVAGLITAENEVLTLTVDRTGMLPGRYSESFEIFAGSVSKTITVILHVAPVDGDYKGYATTTRVNGQPLSIGMVDLNLTLFRRSTNLTEKDFRGVISREQSLLFPRDVYLNGTFFQGVEFFVTSNFEVPAGDRNMPPYTQFEHNNQDAVMGDRDWNHDGQLDTSNPFPFPLRREITLIGKYVNDSLLQGAYYETIQNIVPGQPITIEGDFQLARTSLTPTLTTVENHAANTNVIVGTESSAILTSSLDVTRHVTIKGLQVVVNLDFARGSDVTGTLIAPNGKTNVLFTEGFSGARTFAVADFNDHDAQGRWQLRLSWSSNGERGYFNGWNLSVLGLEVYSVQGQVVTGISTNLQPVLGSHVTLAGNGKPEQRLLTNDNHFVFSDLTENGFTLTVSAPGFQELSQRFSLINDNVDLGNLILQPVTNREPTLVAAPLIGGETLHVNFQPLIPLDFLANSNGNITSRWDFGDGLFHTNSGPSVAPIAHDYAKPGYYTATLSIDSPSFVTNLTTPLITVLSQGSPAGTNLVQITAVSFIGSIASPGPGIAADVILDARDPGVTLDGIPFASVFQESKRDLAAFDIDRYPFISSGAAFSPGAEDTDFFVPPGTPWFAAPPLWDTYDTAQPDATFAIYPPPNRPPNLKPSRFRLCCTLGGFVFAKQPSRVGLYVLQPGRLEP